METLELPLGPFWMQMSIRDGVIMKTSISSKPKRKGKNLNKKFVHIKRAIRRYLAADPQAFHGVECEGEGTEFQTKVWEAVLGVPYGETRTYAQIAKQIGSPTAVRAVGTALGKNPLCLVIPCHRVVPSSGGIGQYAYGCIVKRWLLEHEQSAV